MTTTLETVQRVLCQKLRRETAPPDAEIIKDLGADSLDCIEIIMDLEEALGLEISDDLVWDGTEIITRTVQELATALEGVRT